MFPHVQVAISATEYPSPPQTTETEVEWEWQPRDMQGNVCKDLSKSPGFLPPKKEEITCTSRYTYHPNDLEGAHDFRSVLRGLDFTNHPLWDMRSKANTVAFDGFWDFALR